MKTIEYLKAAKVALGITSDYALAQKLGVTRGSISGLMLGKSAMGDETALKVAEILKLQPVLVMADCHAEREKNPAIKAVWTSLAGKLTTGFDSLISCAIPRRALRSA